MKHLTGVIVFVVKDGQVLLAKKTRILGVGKWNGYGGNLDPELDRDFHDCAVREFGEESGGATIKKDDLACVGQIMFHRGDKFEFDVRIYIASDLSGTPTSSAEMVDPTWFPVDELPPREEFMESDLHWIPVILSGGKVAGHVWYDNDYHLTEQGVKIDLVD